MLFLTCRLIQKIQQVTCLQSAVLNVKTFKQMPFLKHLLQEDLNIIKLLESRKPLTVNDWSKARKSLLELDYINTNNVDAAISNLCQASVNEDAFKSYIQFLKSNNFEINIYVASQYAISIKSKPVLSDLDKDEIYTLFKYVREKHPILHVNYCANFIEALCVTHKWEESLELLDMIKIRGTVNPTPLSNVIKAAFVNNKPEIAWKYLLYAAEQKVNLLPEIFSFHLEYCVKSFKNEELLKNIFKMFEFVGKMEIRLHKHILDDYLVVCQRLGYTYSEATISRQGKCFSCSYQLPAPIISEEDFKKLSELFMEKVLLRDNVYINSTPKEFEQFLKFLKKAVPYDVVIDSLNVACSTGQKSVSDKVERISKVVRYFINENKRILLLGRKHMLRWNNMGYIKHNTKMFLANDESADDPFLLYATLYGGLKTCFLSGDFMRQHKSLMPDDMKSLFKNWQISHQYFFDIKNICVRPPVTFQAIAQQNNNGWHLPYFESNSYIAKDSLDTTSNWICLRRVCK